MLIVFAQIRPITGNHLPTNPKLNCAVVFKIKCANFLALISTLRMMEVQMRVNNLVNFFSTKNLTRGWVKISLRTLVSFSLTLFKQAASLYKADWMVSLICWSPSSSSRSVMFPIMALIRREILKNILK